MTTENAFRIMYQSVIIIAKCFKVKFQLMNVFEQIIWCSERVNNVLFWSSFLFLLQYSRSDFFIPQKLIKCKCN